MDRRSFYTVNLAPGKVVYGEKLFRQSGIEYREWNVTKSKLGAGIAKGIKDTGIVPGCYVLYLGCASGTTVSHVSDIVGKKGLIFAVDLSSRVLRELVFISEERGNIAPILADASKIGELAKTVVLCDVLFQDIAQKTQLAIFLKNLVFLKKDGYAILCVKSRSIDVTKEPKKIFAEIKRELSKHITIIDEKNLYPYEKDHYIFLCRKR